MDRRKICRYFQRGSCKKQKCPFVHLSQNRKNCQFFMQGFCRKGTNCNFYHPPKQSQQQKITRKNYKPTLQKKEVNKKLNHKQQQQFQEDQLDHKQQQTLEKQQKLAEKQIQQKIQQDLQNQTRDKVIQTNNFKKKQINFLLGLGQQTSSDQQYNQQQQQLRKISLQPKRKPLNFVKIYPKKFPDYTKSIQSKQKILENQKLYFNGKKFIELLSKTQDHIQKQHLQIIRKFQDSYIQIINQQKNEQNPNPNSNLNKKLNTFIINLRPLLYQPEIKLHFEMIQDYIQLKINTENYPKQKVKFQILNISIPQQYKYKFIQYLNKLHNKLSIFDTLKLFINTFQKIYQQIKSKLQNQYYSQIQLEQKIKKKLEQQIQKKTMKKQKKQKKNKQKHNQNQNKTKTQNPDLQPIKFNINQKINVSNMNYQIKLDSLMIHNAEYVLAQRFLLYILCQCQKELVHILQADRKQLKIGIKLKCKKCMVHIPIAIQRQVMQLRSQTIGRLAIQNGKLIQIGGIGWKIGCSCDAQIIKPKICLPGYRLNANCIECFKQMQISYMGLGFHNPFSKQNQIIQNQRQLPNKGACKHMKLSFRWIRYGCCGRRFSCDQCHINGSVYQHEKIQGITMLCGFCSYEQPVNKQCMYCKRQLVRGVDKSGHWQGGLGCRDKTLLSKKDAKKYSGLSKPQNKD